MTDEEYLCRAAALIPGCEISDESATGPWLRFNNDLSLSGEVHSVWQWVRDYVAAQLVRQVAEVAKERKQPWLWTEIITLIRKQPLGTDITMFTIKTVIDRGVLITASGHDDSVGDRRAP